MNNNAESRLETLPEGFGIVIVDMQNSFFPGITRFKRDSMVRAQIEVLDSAAKNDFPAILVEYKGYSPTFTEVKAAVERVPRNDFVIKPYSNAFFETDLEKKLDTLGIRCMGLGGVSANVCVQSTAKGAPEEISYLTAETLIADPLMAQRLNSHVATRNHLYMSTIFWYGKHGVECFESHKDLIQLMEQK